MSSPFPMDEPVSLAEAKRHLRVDTHDEDTLIESFISAARSYCEDEMGAQIGTMLRVKDSPVPATSESHGEKIVHANISIDGVEIAGALVEQAGDQIGAAGGVLGIARRAAVEGEIDGDQRQAVFLDQPGLDARGRTDLLDGDGGAGKAGDGGNGGVHVMS